MAIAYEYETTPGIMKVINMSEIRDLTDDDLEGRFHIHILNGYIIRSLIHMLRDVMLYAILELTATSFRILRYDKTGKLIVHLELDPRTFASYFFLSKKDTIRVGINFSQFWTKMKILGKPDPFIATKKEGEDFMTLDFKQSASHQYKLQGVMEQTINIPEYKSPFSNICTSVRELSRAMAAVRTEKSKITFKGYKDTLVVETQNNQTTQRLGSSFDDIWDKIGLSRQELVDTLTGEDAPFCSLHLNEAEDDIEEIEAFTDYTEFGQGGDPVIEETQTHSLLKCLAKVCNVSDNSSVKVTTEPDKPIKLEIPIYQYGTLCFYMFKDSNPTVND